jgi:hypothetical protein
MSTEEITSPEQGELLPNRRARFKGMSSNEVGQPLPFGAEVELTVRGTVTGEGRESRKDGVVIHVSTITVDDVNFVEVTQPEQDPELPYDDDADNDTEES